MVEIPILWGSIRSQSPQHGDVSWLCKIEPLKNDNKNKLETPSIMLNTNRGCGRVCSKVKNSWLKLSMAKELLTRGLNGFYILLRSEYFGKKRLNASKINKLGLWTLEAWDLEVKLYHGSTRPLNLRSTRVTKVNKGIVWWAYKGHKIGGVWEYTNTHKGMLWGISESQPLLRWCVYP